MLIATTNPQGCFTISQREGLLIRLLLDHRRGLIATGHGPEHPVLLLAVDAPALHLVAIDGLSYQQAADATGVPLGTLMSRIGRARAALREMEAAPAKAKNHLKIVGGPS